MVRNLTTTSATASMQLEAEAPWIWLYEVETKDTPPQRYRLTNFPQSVYFDASSTGERLRYYPAPIIHGDIEEDAEGGLPTITITVANTGAVMAATIDDADGFVGQPVRIMVVNSLELDNPSAAIVQTGEVVAAGIDAEAITFRVSAFNLFQAEFPPFIYARRRCRFIFGSVRCGYNTTATGAAFSTCPKTLSACRERGDDEEARGLERLHPHRFGGWPGIPRVST